MDNVRSLKYRIFLATSIIVLFATSAIAADPENRGRGRIEPMRLSAITENGPTVSLHLEDGKVVDVDRSRVRIESAASARHEATAARRNQERQMTLQQLSTMSTSGTALPAVVSVKYAKDGSIKRAKVRVFASEAETTAFLDRRSSRSVQAAKPNH